MFTALYFIKGSHFLCPKSMESNVNCFPFLLDGASTTSAIERLATEVKASKNVLKSKPSEASLKNRRRANKKKKRKNQTP